MTLLAVLTLALVATGFAHRLPSPANQALALAVAQGMTAADLCGDTEPGQPHADPQCVACQIVGTADLPSLSGPTYTLGREAPVKLAAPRENRAVRPVLGPANHPQGPPAVA